MTEQRPSLPERMRELAETCNDLLPDWLEKAEAFEKAINGFWGFPQTVTPQSFLGAYARARLLWCNVTGEPLA